MAILNAAALNMAVPEYTIDQIIGSFTGSLSLTAATSGGGYTQSTATIPHGFGDNCYFWGIFNVDGSSTYNDIGAQTPDLSGAFPVFQTQTVDISSDLTNVYVTGTNFYNYTAGSSSAHTLGYKIYLLAKNSMLNPIAPLATAQILQYESFYKFQKCFQKGTINLTVGAGSTGSTSIIYNTTLTDTPKMRAFYTTSASPNTMLPLYGTALTSSQIETNITSSSLTFTADLSGLGSGINSNIEYRLYLDV